MDSRDILIDCDDVALNYLEGFLPFAEDKLGRSFGDAMPEDFDLSIFLGIDTAATVDLINRFNAGEDGYFGRLKPIPGAVAALRAAHAQGRRISVITASSSLPVVHELRTRNLVDVFGDIFEDIRFVDLDGCKRAHLEDFPSRIWVEDKFSNAILGAEAGHRAYVMRRCHNRHIEAGCTDPRAAWVDDWTEIAAAEGILPIAA